MVRPCVLRHRVTVLTLCPLGEPEIAIGHEPRIEPWLPRNRIACQVSRIDGRCHHSKMNRGNGRAIQRRTSRVIESHQQTVGWISRQKNSRLPAEGEPFLLTSPFIEPPISKRDRWFITALLSVGGDANDQNLPQSGRLLYCVIICSQHLSGNTLVSHYGVNQDLSEC